ncbi:uncharacterized protein LOC131168093 [Malania oleifera]|uniref:uncharacterized protein LOC131168093 n=1 Tax=Malania oleifera TaxID=397392 RepID=UPI0025ADC2FF|nr:uncharacterized protein LOC131168093 [Malania oleifera]
MEGGARDGESLQLPSNLSRSTTAEQEKRDGDGKESGTRRFNILLCNLVSASREKAAERKEDGEKCEEEIEHCCKVEAAETGGGGGGFMKEAANEEGKVQDLGSEISNSIGGDGEKEKGTEGGNEQMDTEEEKGSGGRGGIISSIMSRLSKSLTSGAELGSEEETILLHALFRD